MYHIKVYFKLILFAIVFWTLAFSLFILIRYYAITHETSEVINSGTDVPIAEWINFGLLFGFIFGFVYGNIEYLFQTIITKRIYLGLTIILKSIIYLLLLIFASTFVVSLIESRLGFELVRDSGWWRSSRTFWLVTGYFMLGSLLFNFIRIVNDKFGKGILFKMLTGHYRNPKEEHRIFMFIDLKSSTPIAESLGHYKYSQLLQECFYDINKLVGRYNATIYQYVGDEVVLTWKYRCGIRKNNCLRIFFAYRRLLKRRRNFYVRKFGVLPEFKASIHGGNVMASAVGSVKKELAFHGDVLNTTSRIQEKCNEYGESLLISEEILNVLNLNNHYEVTYMEEASLKGKQEDHKLFAIKEIQ